MNIKSMSVEDFITLCEWSGLNFTANWVSKRVRQMEETEMAEKVGFVVAMRKFFGQLQGQTLPEFSAELKCLTPKDREDFASMLGTVGYEVNPDSIQQKEPKPITAPVAGA